MSLTASDILKDLLWVTMNLEDGNRIAYAGPSREKAKRVAEALCGNRTGADTGEIILYGPGDGTTSVMVRQLPRAMIGPPDGSKAQAACRAALASISLADDGFWHGGPWADPATKDGQGGVIEMLREGAE